MTDTTRPPPVRIISIQLDSLGRTIPEMPPLEIAAAALAVVTILKELTETRPKEAVAVLRGAWEMVAWGLRGGATGRIWVHAQVIQEYFAHGGDWSAMQACLRSYGETDQEAPGAFQRQYESRLAAARRDCEECFGKGPHE